MDNSNDKYAEELKQRDKPRAVVRNKGNLRDYATCPICGKYVDDDSLFCKFCGQRLNAKDWQL